MLVNRLGVVQLGASVWRAAVACLLLDLLLSCVTLKLSRCMRFVWLISMPLGPRLWRTISVRRVQVIVL